MKIVVTGTRGIPDIPGGIETHCKELYPRLAKYGLDIVLIRRSCYIKPGEKIDEFKGVKIKDLYAPRSKFFEAILHTFLSILWAKTNKANIIHIHGIGPGILTPFAHLLGLKVIFTHHGPDYERAKWGKFAKFVLKTGERLATTYANEIIVISEVIKNLLREKYNRSNVHLIFNGVNNHPVSLDKNYIENIGLESHKYIFSLGRFVDEKGFDLLINSFIKLKTRNFKLVIAGDSDHETTYSRQLKDLANKNKVILTGSVTGEKLVQLFSNARLFVLPSYHEGLPISVLEAMSYKLPIILSDISANRQIHLGADRYFSSGDEIDLYNKLSYELSSEFKPVDYDMNSYNWDLIASETISVFELLMK